MTRLEKCKHALDKGYTYNPTTGVIIGLKGNPIKRQCDGYIVINIRIDDKEYNLYGHQFGWYYVYREVVEELDHKNGIRSDNRINNLRSVTHKQNTFNNTVAKGYCFDKSRGKFKSSIKVDGKMINLGRFDKEEDARNCYIEAKKKYHII